jgi:hypothetical protein
MLRRILASLAGLCQWIVLAFWVSQALALAPACSENLCKEKRAKIDTVCHTVGGLVYFEQPDGSMCYCKCSCVEGRTLVAVNADTMTEMHGIEVGDSVLALQANGTWQPSTVTYSDGSTYFNKPVYYAIYVSADNGSNLIVTPDHLFLTADKTLIRADRLQPDTKLLDAELKPVGLARIVPGTFSGSFHNITVGNSNLETVEPDGHYINTQGVVSADFYLQTAGKGMTKVNSGLPQVGSVEYAKRNAASLKGETSLGVGAMTTLQIASDTSFEPHRAVDVPDDALKFLPEELATAKEGLLMSLDETVPYEVADYLVLNYEAKFPDVEMHIDWTNNEVNAAAWMVGSTRHVVLYGGLLRHRYIGVEGAGLVLAHEIGHHFGGKPRYSDDGHKWASCEGQADYWGAMVAQRHVWWGPYAIEQLEKGSDQLYDVFSGGLAAGNILTMSMPPHAAGICGHPSAACRLDTYRAAITLDDKPACAGDPPSLASVAPDQSGDAGAGEHVAFVTQVTNADGVQECNPDTYVKYGNQIRRICAELGDPTAKIYILMPDGSMCYVRCGKVQLDAKGTVDHASCCGATGASE